MCAGRRPRDFTTLPIKLSDKSRYINYIAPGPLVEINLQDVEMIKIETTSYRTWDRSFGYFCSSSAALCASSGRSHYGVHKKSAIKDECVCGRSILRVQAKSLADCIKAISDRNYVGMSIRKEGSGNLIDLGSNDTRWLEGGAWKSLGCTPYLPGPQRITNTISSWNTNKHQWFRQAVCPQPFVELDQPIGIVEAKFMCENDAVPQRLKDIPTKL